MSRSVICRCRHEDCGTDTFVAHIDDIRLLSDNTCCPDCGRQQSPDVIGVPNGLYRHYKGNVYKVTGHGLLTDPEMPVVIYHNVNNPQLTCVRPATMFIEQVEGKPRFQYIGQSSPGLTFPALVEAELNRARRLHPGKQNSLHEAYGVLQEEVDEFWDLVKSKKPDPTKVREELVQVAAMAQRSAEDLEIV